MRKFAITALAMFIVSACGGGGGSGGTTDNTPQSPSPQLDTNNNEYRIHSGVTRSDAKHSPIYYTGDLVRVGVDQGSGPQQLSRLAVPGLENVVIRYGTLNDGAGASQLTEYLASVQGQYTGLSRRLPGYEVRVIGSSTAEERRRVIAAVQLVNAALPEHSKLNVGAPLPGFSLRDTVTPEGIYFGAGQERPNTIHIEFGPDGSLDGSAAATSWGEYILFERGTFPAYVDQRYAVILMAHELVHSLGIGGHVPASFATIMEAGNRVYDHRQEERQPGSLLYPIDREAVRALYGPLRDSADPGDLGPWSGTSEQFFVGIDHGAFGVARRNGYAEPWAYGINPQTTLAANNQLSGNASWGGAIAGFTPSAVRVVGEAGITVNLGNMTGSAAFTELTTIATGGQTAQWNDGDLHYSIAVQGNTFRETGGDAGRLTGVFAGRFHEASGGTLERTDLTAAFGASRQ